MKKYIASPGIALIQPLAEKNTTLILTNLKEGRIIRGKIIDMGLDDTNNYGGKIEAKNYGRNGDIVWFLSYYQEGGYDKVKLDGVEHYLVKWGDFRLQEK